MSSCKSIGCPYTCNPGSDFCIVCLRQHDVDQGDTEDLFEQPEEIDQHQPGAKLDTGKVRMHLITGGMARAIMEVAKVATFGANKYTDGGWIEVPNGFKRYEDAQQRHASYRHMGEEIDPESTLPHLAHEAWNALAKLDLYLRDQ